MLRLLLADDADQLEAVRTRLKTIEDAGEEVLLADVVLAEVAWVLESRSGLDRAGIANVLERLVTSAPFTAQSPEVVLGALRHYRSGTAGFADYLILAIAGSHGADTLFSFDRRLQRSSGCKTP